jgi:hypothetical protein
VYTAPDTAALETEYSINHTRFLPQWASAKLIRGDPTSLSSLLYRSQIPPGGCVSRTQSVTIDANAF